MTTNLETRFVDPHLLRQAEQQCRQRLLRDPDNRAALRSLAEVQRKLGDLALAAESYNRVFALDPGDQEAGYLGALCGGQDWTAAPSGMRASPFVLVRDFLPRAFHDSLVPFATANREKFVPALIGQSGQNNPDIRQTLEFLEEWPGRDQFRDLLLAALPRVIPRLNLAPFEIDPRAIPIQVRAYPDGHFYKAHMDAPRNSPRVNRVINFVYYFHRVPRPYTGGELLLFDSDVEADTYTRARFTRVVTEDNTIIFFPSPYYHSVLPVECPSKDFSDSRFAINGHVFKRLDVKPEHRDRAEPARTAPGS